MKPSLKFRLVLFLWFLSYAFSSVFIPPGYAQTEQGVLESPAPQVTGPVSGSSSPKPVSPSGVPTLRVIKPAPTRDVGRLMQDLVAEISRKAKTFKTQETVSTPRTIASTPTVFESVPKIAKPKKLKKQAVRPEPAYNLSKPVLDPNQIQSIARNIPTGGIERKEIVEKIATVAEGVKQGREGSDEDAVRLIRKLREYTFDPYVISGKRLAASKSRLSNVPRNVSIVNKEELLTRNPKTVQEAMGLLEGVVMYDQIGNGWENAFGLRGFETGTEVAVIVDGVRYNEPDGGVVNYSLVNVDDVESIEVARGSYSGVYGNSAFGGVVNITTRQAAEEKFRPFGTFEYGMNGLFDFAGGASGTIPDMMTGMEGDVKYVFSMARKLADNIRSNSEARQTHLLTKWGYVWPEDVAGVQFQLTHSNNAMSNPGELTVSEFHHTPDTSKKPMDGRGFENLVLQFDSHLRLYEKVNLKLNAYRRREDIDFTTTSISQIPFTVRNVTQFLTTKAFTASAAYEESIWFLDNTLEGGIEYRDEDENDRAAHITDRPPFSPVGFYGDQSIDLETTGPFLQNTVTLFDRMVATVGLRHDRIEYNYDDSSFPDIVAEPDFDDTTMQVGTVLKLFDQAEAYWNFSEGFRAPSISELFSVNLSGSGNTNLMPEESDSYEVGLRVREYGPFSGNVSFFLIDLDDEILFDPNVRPYGKNINLGKSRRSGIEFSLKCKPADWIDAFFTYTFTQAELRSTLPFPDNPDMAPITEAGSFQSGDDIGLVPRNRLTLGTTMKLFRNLRLHLDGIYTGSQRSQGYEALGSEAALFGAPIAGRGVDSMMDGYLVANGRVSLLWKDMEVYFQVSNIFDTDYISRSVTATTFYTVPPYTTENVTFVTPGQGREMSVGTRLKFG